MCLCKLCLSFSSFKEKIGFPSSSNWMDGLGLTGAQGSSQGRGKGGGRGSQGDTPPPTWLPEVSHMLSSMRRLSISKLAV